MYSHSLTITKHENRNDVPSILIPLPSSNQMRPKVWCLVSDNDKLVKCLWSTEAQNRLDFSVCQPNVKQIHGQSPITNVLMGRVGQGPNYCPNGPPTMYRPLVLIFGESHHLCHHSSYTKLLKKKKNSYHPYREPKFHNIQTSTS